MNPEFSNPEHGLPQTCVESDKPPVRIHYEQMLMEAMTIMSKTGAQTLCIYDDHLCLGTISRDEIIKFLNQDGEDNLSTHKLCFTMETLLALRKKDQ